MVSNFACNSHWKYSGKARKSVQPEPEDLPVSGARYVLREIGRTGFNIGSAIAAPFVESCVSPLFVGGTFFVLAYRKEFET